MGVDEGNLQIIINNACRRTVHTNKYQYGVEANCLGYSIRV